MGAVGAQLLSELDHALHITKEEPNIWFGGMIVIFAGDFHQHALVSETPLYQPISNIEIQSNTEISKQLGQLAWKSINAVVWQPTAHRMTPAAHVPRTTEQLNVMR